MLAFGEARVAGHAADGAEQDRVVRGDRGEVGVGRARRRSRGTGAAPSEKWVFSNVTSLAGRRGIENLERLGDDLRADPVAGDDSEFHDTATLHSLRIATGWALLHDCLQRSLRPTRSRCRACWP